MIDRLCQVGALRYHVAFVRPFGPEPNCFYLIADRTGRAPVSDSGPFRIQITAISAVFQRDFSNGRDQPAREGEPPDSGTLTVSLLTLAEPGVQVELNGSPIVSEATDDRGRSLTPADPPRSTPVTPAQAFA